MTDSGLPPSFTPSSSPDDGGRASQPEAQEPRSFAPRQQQSPSGSRQRSAGDAPFDFMNGARGGAGAGSGASAPQSYAPSRAASAPSRQRTPSQSGAGRSSSGQSAQYSPAQYPSQYPPSFQPSRDSGQAAPPSIPPSGSSAANAPLPSYIAPTPGMPASESPAGYGAPSYPPQAGTYAPPQRTGLSNGGAGSAAAGVPGAAEGRQSRRRRRRRRPGRTILLIVAVLLIAAIVFVQTQIAWVNSHLQHEDMLSGATNTLGSTWLLLGSDERDGTAGGVPEDTPGFRTDTILVLTKPNSGPASLISIPRDSYVTVNGADSKINAVAELYGYPQLVRTVEEITGITIDHVVRVGFAGVTKIVDAVGGIDLCLDYDVNDVYSGLNWTAGCKTVDGQTALAFARMRYQDPQGDIGRAARQRQVISAIMKKVSDSKVFLNYSKLHSVGSATMEALTVDENTNAWTMVHLAQAFSAASGSGGVTGSVYFTNIGYYPPSGIGSCVLLDTDRNLRLFKALSHGTQEAGTVGGYTGA